MVANKWLRKYLLIFFALTVQYTCIAQKQPGPSLTSATTFFLQGTITLDSLTKYIHKHSSIRFSFNSAKVIGSTEIVFPKKTYTLTELLSQVRKSTSLYYSFYNGYVIFQDNPPKQNPGQQKAISKQPSESSQIIKSNPPSHEPLSKKTNTSKIKETHSLKPAIVAGIVTQSSTRTPTPSAAGKAKVNVSDLTLHKRPTRQISNSAIAGASTSSRTGVTSFHTGLLWNIPVPWQGFNSYFTWTNGHSQPYNLLIPGVWASLVFNDKSDLMVQFRPAQQFFTGQPILSDSTERTSVRDSSFSKKTRRLIKTQGAYIALQYDYYVLQKLHVGLGLEYNWVGSALINYNKSKKINGALVYDSTTSISKSNPDWQYLKPSFVAAKMEIAYSIKRIEAGLVFILPLSDISSVAMDRVHLLNSLAFLRWTIWQSR